MQEKTFFSPSKLKAALIYLIMLLLGSTLFGVLFGLIIASIKGVDPGSVASSFIDNSKNVGDVAKCHVEALGYANFATYLLAALGVGFYLRNYLVEDFIKIKNNRVKSIVLIIAFALAFTALALVIDLLFKKIAGDSNNQTTIIEIMKTSAVVPMIIATVIFAPIVEEFVYRKIIFEALKDYSLIPCYVASIICFALPHMLSPAASVGIWFLQLIPYMILGGMLCFVFHINNFNVYASIAAHMLNNLVAVIMLFI